ncbi:hypothetical protein EYR41_009284 [Orbilia oligospora]|uniref:Uncharacterized protein n=1 Tax=Orbilia oligospora TaxID=2813651 RepID=A0A7C8PF30_ORBOL|nr:hypothetical protein TWF751_003872 [Orbilia oligospora]KAF3274965.1 hypothetical protein TWF132_003221 [Orbilia oligospora]TGJ65304.1 hypothetical protein EYR41_009284 [Orbilia oligospora]
MLTNRGCWVAMDLNESIATQPIHANIQLDRLTARTAHSPHYCTSENEFWMDAVLRRLDTSLLLLDLPFRTMLIQVPGKEKVPADGLSSKICQQEKPWDAGKLNLRHNDNTETCLRYRKNILLLFQNFHDSKVYFLAGHRGVDF